MSYISVFRSVPNILGGSGRAEIDLAIVKAVAVDVIYEHIVRYLKYLPMHKDTALGAVFVFHITHSVVGTFTSASGVPFILGQPAVIIGIDDGVFALCQRDSAEGVAVAQAPVQKHRRSKQP